MKLLSALIVSSFAVSLAAAAPSSPGSNSLIDKKSEVPFDEYSNSVITLRSREEHSVYFFGIHHRESEALSRILGGFAEIFSKGRFDYPEFTKRENEWTWKLSEIENNVKGKLPGEYNLDSMLEFTQRQFNYMKKANDYNIRFKKEDYVGSEFLVEIAEMRAKIGSLLLADGTIPPSVKDIDTQIAKLEKDYSEMNSDVREEEDMIRTLRNAYDESSVDVGRALQELKQKAAERTRKEEICG